MALRSAASSACIAAPSAPSSSMSPMTAMRRPLRPGLCRAEQRQRGAHRGGIGVVALVDDRRRTVRRRDREARAPALLRRKLGQRRGAARRRPRRARRPARSAPSAFCAMCRPGAPSSNRNSRPSSRARTREPAVDRRRPRAVRASQSPPRAESQTRAPRAVAAFASRSNCGASRLRTAVPPGSSPRKISALASAIASIEPRCSM